MGRSCSVLVVDDDPELRSAIAELLAGEGYAVASAANGQEALRVLRAGRSVDVILLDLMMPIMNGWQFRREQGDDPNLYSIPVVVLSAGQSIDDVARSLGAVAHLRKPLRLTSLLDLLEQVCSRPD